MNIHHAIFQKGQNSHSRHKKNSLNLPRINLKGILQFIEIWPLEGVYVHNSMGEWGGGGGVYVHPKNVN